MQSRELYGVGMHANVTGITLPHGMPRGMEEIVNGLKGMHNYYIKRKIGVENIFLRLILF